MTLEAAAATANAALLERALGSLRASFPEEVTAAAPEDAAATSTRAASEAPNEESLSLSLSVPSLSLHHETRLEHRNNKKRVEEHAACLLSRPIQSSTIHIASTRTTTTTETARLIMENLSESFGVLLDARLRAYATFLARHGIALAKTSSTAEAPSHPSTSAALTGALGMEDKVMSLLEMGASVRARQMTLEFTAAVVNEADAVTCDDDGGEIEAEPNDDDAAAAAASIRRYPVQLTASMQLQMTGPKGEPQQLRDVHISAHGNATVTKMKSNDDKASSSSYEVVVELNTRQLLECMIHQASDVVEHVVDAANTSSILKASRLCRSSSYLAMPPPPPNSSAVVLPLASSAVAVNPRRSESFLMLPNVDDPDDDDDNEAAAAAANRRSSSSSSSDSNIVSPDTNALSSDSKSAVTALLGLGGGAARSDAIPPLDLNESCHDDDGNDDDDDEYFLQDLSPEACESIVDGIFGGSGDDMMLIDPERETTMFRAAKKPRIEAPPSPRAGGNNAPVLVRL